ncbi:UNVERIFIED_CONTAM: hypothetical protein Slati_0313800 [Sesamum latifolium]|uniref:PRA1 family protein n=1 Tax=Sesamum latifolium TaxID=2727402 RepID=A0AAW2YEQ1_9LAMI
MIELMHSVLKHNIEQWISSYIGSNIEDIRRINYPCVGVAMDVSRPLLGLHTSNPGPALYTLSFRAIAKTTFYINKKTPDDALAVREAIVLALQQGWPTIMIEGDCAPLIAKFSSARTCFFCCWSQCGDNYRTTIDLSGTGNLAAGLVAEEYVLFIALIPQRKDSVVCLVITTEITFLYFLLLRSFPDSVLLHKIIDKRLVLFLLFVITAVLLILTRAAVHFFVVLAATLPVVLLHAVLSRTEDVVVHEEAGEMARLVQERLGDAARPETLV